MKPQKTNRAKRLVMQPVYRQRIVRDKTKYLRNAKHKKAPGNEGFFMCAVSKCA